MICFLVHVLPLVNYFSFCVCSPELGHHAASYIVRFGAVTSRKASYRPGYFGMDNAWLLIVENNN